MAKLIPRKSHFAFFAAAAALLLAPISMPLRAQEQPNLPAIFDTQTPGMGWLGVSIDEVSSQKAQDVKLPGNYGVLVTEVTADSPAAKAGLRDGDVITDYDGQRVEGVFAFRRLVRETPPGRPARLIVWRDGRSQLISVEIGKNEAANQSPFQNMMRRFGNPGPSVFGFGATLPTAPTLGIAGHNLSGQLGKFFGAPDDEAVLVTNVESNSPAAKAGLEAGDVITKVDGNRVRTMGELRDQLRMKREAKNVTLSVLRKGSEMSVNIEPREPRRGRSQGAEHSIPL